MIGTSDGEQFNSHYEHLASMLGGQDTEKPVDEVKVDRTKDVPYISGPSNDGKTVYIDKSVPEKATISGVTFDTAEPLKIHELVEKTALEHYLNQGMDNKEAYKKAHEDHAEPAENAWYHAHGIDIAEADKWWSRIDQKTEQEGTGDHPKDLFKAPYPHGVVEGAPGATHNIDDPSWAKAKDIVDTFGGIAFQGKGIIPSILRHQGIEPPEWMKGIETASNKPEVTTALGLFGGMRGMTPPILAKAQKFLELEEQGVHPASIWKQTGIRRGAEGELKFEVPDFKTPMMEVDKTNTTVGELLPNHPIFEHYPELKNLDVMQTAPKGNGRFSATEQGMPFIEIPKGGPDRHAILMHEVQHWIQHHEGFARGGNPMEMMRAAAKAYPEYFEQGGLKNYELSPTLVNRFNAAADKAYRDLAGETESNVVANRLRARDETRYPGITEKEIESVGMGTTPDKQIVLPQRGRQGFGIQAHAEWRDQNAR